MGKTGGPGGREEGKRREREIYSSSTSQESEINKDKNRLPWNVVSSPFLEAFKQRQDERCLAGIL